MGFKGFDNIPRIIVAGGRDFNDYEFLKDSLVEELTKYSFLQKEIVSGGARGADRLGERFAEEFNINLTIFKANWGFYGVKAGFIRNVKMAEYSDILFAFWDGKSRGTKMMINEAKKRGLIVKVFRYEG